MRVHEICVFTIVASTTVGSHTTNTTGLGYRAFCISRFIYSTTRSILIRNHRDKAEQASGKLEKKNRLANFLLEFVKTVDEHGKSWFLGDLPVKSIDLNY